MSLADFHPAVADWFARSFSAPTPVQLQAWAAIRQGKSTLLAAPTGSGKTLAAFLASIDELVREGLQHGLADETYVLYVSPLEALMSAEVWQEIYDRRVASGSAPVERLLGRGQGGAGCAA